ncbi:hypothetical protein COL35_18845 [Bacillus toyonensis]|nr:hypothetical protein COL35_18845 [Bacillus toyonensis]
MVILTECLEGFYHVGTIMEHGWKADLSATLKGYKKIINQNRWISVFVFAMQSLIKYPYV